MLLLLLSIGCRSNQLSSGQCPTGLVPVPEVQPVFCMQPFESRIDDGKALSKQGEIPSVNVSLLEAIDTCQSTSIDGQSLRLATLSEWQDAGDGMVGMGGFQYPWGDDKDDTLCVLDSPTNPMRWKTIQPTGSKPDCVSKSGVYDQIGNAWEWVDLERIASRTAWVELITTKGFTVAVSKDSITMDSRLLPRIRLQTICVDFARMKLEASKLTIQLNSLLSPDCESAGKGYLVFNERFQNNQQQSIPQKGSILPIKIRDNLIVWDHDRDGEVVGAKVGGSFYSGAQMTLQQFWIGHIPTFNGSIGFRCSSDPL